MGGFKERHPRVVFALKVVALAVIGFGLFCLFAVGMAVIAFNLPKQTLPVLCWLAFCLALLLHAACFMWKSRGWRRIANSMMLCALLVAGGAAFHRWWTVGRFPVVGHDIDWGAYEPFSENNKLVKVEVPSEFRLEGNEPPKMTGAYALYPIYAAVAQAMCPREFATRLAYLSFGGSDLIYDELLAGERDLIFALAPSKSQREEAEKAGLTYEMTPFCRDAFVFYVNAKNPVAGLTTEQIKGIYAGKIANWREIQAGMDAPIVAFQRNEGSGSQTALERLMAGTPIMPPLKEDRVGGMGDIIKDTANYRNYRAALGFSFRYYATELLRHDQIKLLPIDGVAPTVGNIQNGRYPHVATAYVVTVRPRSASARKIVDFLLSPAGQDLVAKTGYVPLGDPKTGER